MSSNGAIPLTELTPVGNGFYLQHNTAAAFLNLRQACLDATGVYLIISAGDGAYRTLAEQQYELDLWIANGRHGTRPANPGGSNHGWGTAVDIANWGSAGKWLMANADRFNFSRPFSDELWHFQYVGPITAAEVVTAISNTKKEDTDMARMITVSDGKTPYAIITPLGKIILDDGHGNRVDPSALAVARKLYDIPEGSDQIVAKSAYDYFMAKIPTVK